MNTHRLVCVLGTWAAWLCSTQAPAADYYVATTGSDNNPGTEAQPFATVGRGQQAASPGDTVWVRGGTYAISSGTVGVAFSKAGQANNLINYFAYPDETPIFDLSPINPSGRVTGFDVQTNYIHIRGMEITGVPQYMSGQDSWGLRIRGNNNIIEQMNVHHNEGPGIFITSGSDNTILNCDSHHNYDVLENGGSGDGFGCHSTGGGNVISGCRGWSNSDDGYDFINAPGVCTVENSWSWKNGWVPDTNNAAGNGAGFKAGGFGLDSSTFPSNVPVHVVQKCVAWGNRAQGFYANHHPGALHFFNNTAYNNPKNYDMLDDVRAGTHLLRNNIAFGTGGNLSNSTNDDSEDNSWDGGVSVSEADFVSVSDTGADGPRQADGSLPSIAFMHLADGSDLIDAGIDVGLPYNDSAPDLGAFESGDVPTTDGSGGTSTTDGGTTTNTASGDMTTTDGGGMNTTSGATDVGATGTTDGLTSSTDGSTTSGAGTMGTGSGTPTGSVSGTTGAPGTTTTAGTSSGATTGSGGATGNASATGSLDSGTTSGTGAAAEDDAGCACSLPARTNSWAHWWLLALAGLVLARRRRR